MQEVHLSNFLIGASCLSVAGGMVQLLCQALEVRRAKRGRIRAGPNFGRLSIRSTALGRHHDCRRYALGGTLVHSVTSCGMT